MIPNITIAGTTSGVGKTSITLGILYKLKKMGYKVQSFKVGPDFIDPSYHSIVTNNNSYNLDTWLMGIQGVIDTFERTTKNVDLAVIEGVMGLYDGAGGKTDFASTAQIAKILKSQIILVIDASKASRSIAAMAYGFILFDRKLKISGIILNKIASIKHFNFIKDSFACKINAPIIGTIYKNSDFNLTERHMGLIPSTELNINKKREVLNAAKYIADAIKIDNIISSLKIPTSRIINTKKMQGLYSSNPIKKPSVKIAVAFDNSFNFYYRENLDKLQQDGAKLVFFSPVNDKNLPEEVGGIIIGGGFPEILSKQLAQNYSMLKEIKKAAEDDQIPIYAECGGLMYLTRFIKESNYLMKFIKGNDNFKNKKDNRHKNDDVNQGKKGKKYKMVGLIDATTEMTSKPILNYTEAEIISDSIISKKGRIRGHEFHFSKILDIPEDSLFLYKLSKGIGIHKLKDGLLTYNTLASYMHIHFANTRYTEGIINACKIYLKK